MLMLFAILAHGAFLVNRSLWLESMSETPSEKNVHAYVDGKPVRSYVKVK